MNTMIGYTVQAETDASGKIVHSLLMLARQFLGQTEAGIQTQRVWESDQMSLNVPPRVWKRHSALLTLLLDQTEKSEPRLDDGK